MQLQGREQSVSVASVNSTGSKTTSAARHTRNAAPSHRDSAARPFPTIHYAIFLAQKVNITATSRAGLSAGAGQKRTFDQLGSLAAPRH